VTLRGGSRAKGLTARATLDINPMVGTGIVETFDTLKVEGQGVMRFNVEAMGVSWVKVRALSIETEDDSLFIRGWIDFLEVATTFLVSRAFAPNAATLARIWFEGWEQGAALRDYAHDGDYWEIVPMGIVPEPATYGAILGAVGLGVWAWRNRLRRHLRRPISASRC